MNSKPYWDIELQGLDPLARAQELRKMADEFRSKAGGTTLTLYVELMNRSAKELDQLAEQLEQTFGEPLPLKANGTR